MRVEEGPQAPAGRGDEKAAAAHFGHEAPAGEVAAWEEIDTGRFMPRRFKGSYRGRALG
jgi:hypothetical protein